MDIYDLIKSQKNGISIATDGYEYNMKVNNKRQIVVKARADNVYYYSNQIDRFDAPSSARDSAALIQRVKSWRQCKSEHTPSGAGNGWWCSQDHNTCPVCAFQKVVEECEKEGDATDECSLCGTTMARVYTGNNKKNIMPECNHSVCQSCMDSMIDTSAYNAPELEGYKLNCPFCRAENIIKY
jgi:hypothetical protein